MTAWQDEIIKQIEKVLHNGIQTLKSTMSIDKCWGEIQYRLNEVIGWMLGIAIECLDDELVQMPEVKEEWETVKKDKRTIVLPQIEINYRRRYYRNKRTKEYAYLIDDLLGISKYQRLSDGYIQKLLMLYENSQSYTQVHKELVHYNKLTSVSVETIRNKIKYYTQLKEDRNEKKNIFKD